MSLLSINTSGSECSVAILNSKNEIFYNEIQLPNMHAESLFSLIDHALTSSNLKKTDITKVLTTIGPGSFFGTRVGIAASQGFGLALGISVFGVSSLELDAFCRIENSNSNDVVAFAPMGKKFILTQSFSNHLVPIGSTTHIEKANFTERSAADMCRLFLYKQSLNLNFSEPNPIYYSISEYKKMPHVHLNK